MNIIIFRNYIELEADWRQQPAAQTQVFTTPGSPVALMTDA
jgi:hypothetical protein